jgi:urease accessory protein
LVRLGTPPRQNGATAKPLHGTSGNREISLSALVSENQRADGAAHVAFRLGAGGRTVLSDLYQRAPCRVLFPSVEADELMQAVLLTTSGGLTGGDRTQVTIEVEEGARAVLTTQAAEKLYRSVPYEPETAIQVQLRVAQDAWAEWLPQEAIVFNGARLRREIRVDLARTARLLATESLVLGRVAMGERFDSGSIHDAWRIRRAGRLIWADALHLHGAIPELLSAPFGFGTAVAYATVVYVGDDAEARLQDVRLLLAEGGVHAGATAFDGMLLTRFLSADAAALRRKVMQVVARIRHCAAGLPAQLPRVWYC